jgi:sulfite reductase (NADPH) flavoprotein alpha-component
MAQGVDDTLRAVLGTEQMEQLVRSGRYRRDVY